MHRELLRELSVITEEERKILDGRKEIDQQIYTEKKIWSLTVKSFSRRGSLFKYVRTPDSYISQSIPIIILK